jgi:hypothetical protein
MLTEIIKRNLLKTCQGRQLIPPGENCARIENIVNERTLEQSLNFNCLGFNMAIP